MKSQDLITTTHHSAALGAFALGFGEVLALTVAAILFMTALIRCLATLHGAGEEEVNRVGSYGFLAGVLLAVSVVILDCIWLG